MTSRPMAALAAALIAMTMGAGGAPAKEKITYAHLADPSVDGILYAIKTGKVTSDLIEIETLAQEVAALIQSTPTKRYDVLMNAVMAIPAAKARGLDLVVLSAGLRAAPAREGGGVWVRKDSPIKSIAELKGKTIGSFALNSTGTTWVRIALWKKYGVNVSYENGDFEWVQMPAPALLGALQAGRIDAATLIHAQAFLADKSGEYRVLTETNRDLYELYGVDALAAVNVSYPDKLAARPEAFKEFNRMIKASVDYAHANVDEVGEAIAKQGDITAEFFKAWLERFSVFPGVVTEGDLKAMETVWAAAKEMGMIQDFPKAETVIWEHAIRQ